jgi:hypothetical protein
MEKTTTEQARENEVNDVPREYYQFIIRIQSELIRMLDKRKSILEKFFKDINELTQKRK